MLHLQRTGQDDDQICSITTVQMKNHNRQGEDHVVESY